MDTIWDAQIKTAIEKRLIIEAGDKRPQISFDATVFNFGQVSKKQGKISETFRLSNKGDSPLIIRSLKTSCPCASVSLKVNKTKSPFFGPEGSPRDWQAEIKPQQTAELELMVDLDSVYVRPGKLIRDASVISNDPIYPETIVKVEAEVLE
ncbi:MAG: DUF1573 domain-containing protein [Candidatus Omnitrophica bacterium]|nr:DUF1573 domain-containing protein [Candidatus Omnitrophota bacterium]